MPLVPVNSDTLLSATTFEVYSDGDLVPPEIGYASITVQSAINRIPRARLVLFDGDVTEGDFSVSAGELFVPGKSIEIKAGYNGESKSIFKGVVIRHGIEIIEGNTSKLVIELKDPSVRLTVGRKNKYFFDSKDSEILEEIINGYSGISADVEDTPTTHASMVQYYVTDWDFILTRAEINGKLVFVEDSKVIIKKPEVSADPKLDLAFGANVVEFQAEMDARRQYTTSKGFSWDKANQELKEVEASDPGLDIHGNFSPSELADIIGLSDFRLQHIGALDNTELQAWTDASLLRSRLSKIQGSIKVTGTNQVKPGDLVKLDGFGERFNGKAFVSSVYHEVTNQSGWFTHLGIGLEPKFISEVFDDILDPPAAGIIPAIKGLHVGKVTSLEDPEGEHRVRIFIPVIEPSSEGIWARMASPDAGEGDAARGIFFMPEVDDEVIVGFINEDPRDPVILGKLYSSAKPAPFEQTENNFQKGIVTKTGLKLVFDDEVKSITLETPNGNKMTISDQEKGFVLEDENGNKVVLNSDGVQYESSKDFIIKASGDVKIEGVNIEIKASAELKAEGGAGAEFSSSGATNVKGSLVQIN
jgi:Rhs element Vgr protein